MLVLTRTTGQEIRLGDDVVVKVLKSKGGRVKLAIDAPRGVRILRGEIASTIECMTPVQRTIVGEFDGAVAQLVVS